jgi:hypothetical protein
MHGFSDQALTLFASSDEGRAATGAGLAYLDTLAPSKLADFQRHVRGANAYCKQGLTDLNARLSELGTSRADRPAPRASRAALRGRFSLGSPAAR